MATIKNQNVSDRILSDTISNLMWKLSLPAIIGMSVNGINAFVDALFVGQFIGQEALAAISLAFPLTMITNAFTAMIGIGSASLLSRALGADDEEVMEKSFGTLLSLTLVVSVFLTGLGVYFARDLIAFMGGKGEILSLGTQYYRIMMIGALLRVFGVAANMLIRAEGKLKEAMIIAGAGAIFNMILNPIFIGWFGWGIEGAAWATVAAMGLFTALDLVYFTSGKVSYPIRLNRLVWDRKMLRPVLSVGVSAMMLQLMFFVQQAVVFKSLAYYGTDWDLAFMGGCYRVLVLLVMPVFGFAQALQPVAGINFGAKHYERVREAFKVFTQTGVLVLTCIWIFLMFFPEIIMGWMIPGVTFSSTDMWNFRMFMLTIPLFPVFFMGTTLFQAIGNAKAALILQLSRELLLFVPMLLILPLYFGVRGIYSAGVPVNVLLVLATVLMVSFQMRKLTHRRLSITRV